MRRLNIIQARNGFQLYLTDTRKDFETQNFVALDTEILGVLVRSIMDGEYDQALGVEEEQAD
jgi:hypothetical protein